MSDNIKTKICDACNLYKNYYYTLKTASYMPYPVGPAAQSVIKSGGELCRYCAIYDANILGVNEHSQQLLESYSQAMNIYKSVMDKYNQKTLVEEPVEEVAVAAAVAGGYKRSRRQRSRRSKRKQSRLSKRKSIKKKSKKNRRR